MRRRDFITLVGGAAVVWPRAARAEQQVMPVVGYLSASSPTDTFVVTAFNQGLSETGFLEGKNVVIERHWAAGQYDRLPELAADLVRRGAAVIAAVGGPNSALAAKSATAATPIVFVSGTDPVDTGLVTSLNRPGGNLTGVHMLGTLLNLKRLELLRELVPSAALVAILVNPTRVSTQHELREVQGAADKIGQQLQVLSAKTDREIETAFATIVQRRVGGLIVQTDPFFTGHRDQLILLTTRHAIPTIFPWREFATAGGLMSYGPSLRAAYRQAGIYAGRILKGEGPASLPVVQSTTLELVVNLKAARVLGIDVPATLSAIADEVIE